MKRKITLLLLAAASVFSVNSQVVLSENFTATFTPASAGWGVQNLSNPVGTLSWFQGNSAVFSAYNGGANDYFAANFNSQGSTAGGISNWLITPTVTIYNGAVIEFVTRISNTAPNLPFPDRLQLRMSTAGVSSVIPTGTASVGSFTDLLLDINPQLTTNTTSAVNNGTVNGYPNAWTVYSVQVSGVTGTVTGRFAFRYFVDDGGANGNNSSYIGLDAVKYTLPCEPTVQSYTTCANASTTLSAMGLPATTYSWSTGSTNSSIVVNPAVSTTYTLYPSANSLACANTITAAITVSSNLVVNVTASSNSVCSGQTVTLTASGSASSYAWTQGTNILGTNPSITVAPTSNTTYSVGGLNGACQGGNFITITTAPNPTVSITSASTLLCVSGPSTSVSFTGNGATNYIWVTGSSQGTGGSIGLNIPAQTATTPATQQLTLGVIGVDGNGCFSTDVFTLTVSKNPVVTVTSSTATACTNSTVNLTGAGASSYTWAGAASSTVNPLAFSTGTTAGAKQFTLTGVNADGCTGSIVFSQNVVVCNTNTNTVGLSSVGGYEETSIFPNPFTTEIKINVLDGNVIVYNALGQVVVNTAVHSSETINTTELPKGAYIVKAYNTNGELVKTVKLIKN